MTTILLRSLFLLGVLLLSACVEQGVNLLVIRISSVGAGHGT